MRRQGFALWPAPGFVDTRLGYICLPLEVHGAEISRGCKRIVTDQLIDAMA
jgi:hypothetical protein